MSGRARILWWLATWALLAALGLRQSASAEAAERSCEPTPVCDADAEGCGDVDDDCPVDCECPCCPGPVRAFLWLAPMSVTGGTAEPSTPMFVSTEPIEGRDAHADVFRPPRG